MTKREDQSVPPGEENEEEASRPVSAASNASQEETPRQDVSDTETEIPVDNGSGDEGFESDEPVKPIIPEEPTRIDEIKSIMTNLTDEGLDRLFQLIPTLTEKEIAYYDPNDNSWLHWISVSKTLHSLDQNKLVSVIIAFSIAGINYNKRNHTKNTALHFAVACKAPLRMINTLLKIGVDPGFKNDKNRTARLCTEDRAIIKTLEMFTPPLDESIRAGETEKVNDLLSYWVKVTNYHTDIAKRHPDIRENLLQTRTKIDLIYRALTGNTDALMEADDELLAELPLMSDESYVNPNGDILPLPLLFLLITNPYCVDCAIILLQRGCDVNFSVSYRADGMTVPFWIWFQSTDHPRKDELLPLIQANIDYEASLASISHDYMIDFLNSNREIFDQLIDKDYAFWKLDKMFRNLSDLALWNALKADKKHLVVSKVLSELQKIDQALIPFFKKWDDDKLQAIQDAGYWPLISFKTMHTLEKSKDEADVKLVWRIKGLDEKWVLYRKLRQLIQLGNTAGFRDLVQNEDICERKDKAGQTLIHYATIYERRFILKHLLDKKPSSVDFLDHNGRTALHYSQGIEEEFIYNLLDRAGADKYIVDKTVNSNEMRRSSMYPILSDADMVQSFYRQAIRVERREIASYSHYLLQMYLSLHEAIETDAEDKFNSLVQSLWPDLTWETFAKVNKMFPNQPHKLPNLISFCIKHHREEFGRELLKNGHPLDAEVKTGDGVFMVEEYARKENLHQLADDIEHKKNSKKLSPDDHTYHSDEGDTIFSIYTANSANSTEEDQTEHKPHKKKHKKKDGSSGKKKKKKKSKDKVEESEVCTIL